MFKQSILILAIAACGGKAAPATTAAGGGGMPVPPASQCDITARHMTDAVFAWKEPPPTSKDNVFGVLRAHCNDDKWSQEAMDCFQKVTDEASSQPCAEKLSKDQVEKVMGDMMSKFEKKKMNDAMSPESAPTGADPCEGGE